MDTIIRFITAIGITCILLFTGLVFIEPNNNLLSTITGEIDNITPVIIEGKESIQIPEVNVSETTEPQNPETKVEITTEPVEPVKETETADEPVQKENVQVESKPEPVKEQPVKEEVKSEPVKEAPKEKVKEQTEKKVEKKKEPVKEKFKEPTTDNIKSIDRARKLTKDYCSEDLWHSWNDERRKQEKNSDFIGLATRDMTVEWADEEYTETIDTLFIKLFISPELNGNIKQSTWTAWHECGHAKTYLIPVDKQEQVLKNIDKQFGDCNGNSSIECLADAMAQVKTGYKDYGYYQNSFTDSELKLAKEIWNMSGTAQVENVYDVDAYNRIP